MKKWIRGSFKVKWQEKRAGGCPAWHIKWHEQGDWGQKLNGGLRV